MFRNKVETDQYIFICYFWDMYVPIIYAILCMAMLVVRLAPCHYLNQCWHTLTWTNFIEVYIKISISFFQERRLKISCAKRRPFQLSQHKFVRLWKSQMLCEHPILIITKINIDMSHPSMKMLTHPPWTKWPPFVGDLFRCILMNEKLRISVLIFLKFVPKVLIGNKSALV